MLRVKVVLFFIRNKFAEQVSVPRLQMSGNSVTEREKDAHLTVLIYTQTRALQLIKDTDEKAHEAYLKLRNQDMVGCIHALEEAQNNFLSNTCSGRMTTPESKIWDAVIDYCTLDLQMLKRAARWNDKLFAALLKQVDEDLKKSTTSPEIQAFEHEMERHVVALFE